MCSNYIGIYTQASCNDDRTMIFSYTDTFSPSLTSGFSVIALNNVDFDVVPSLSHIGTHLITIRADIL